MIDMKVKRLVELAVIPSRASLLDAGYDLVATSYSVQGEFIEYSTGISIELPEGYHAEIFPRSSISKYDLSLANSVGLIDNGYRGELKLRFKVTNKSNGDSTRLPIIYEVGDKIGQLVLRKTITANIIEVDSLSSTDRGSGGFGSTGN